jgi:hypothetical protein
VRRSIGLLAAAACLLAGCNYDLDPELKNKTPPVVTIPAPTTTLPPPVQAAKDPRRAILVGGDKIVKAGTVQMRITAEVVGGEPAAIAGKGAFDLGRHAGQLTLTLPNDQGSLAVVNVGNTYYVKSPVPQLARLAKGRPWIGVNTATLTAGERSRLLGTARLPADTDPVAEMGILRGLTGQAEDLGPTILPELGPVRGYRMLADLRKATRSLQPDMRKRFQQLGITTLPVDLWLDGFGFLRRIRYTLEQQRLVSGPGVSVTADFSDFGKPVKITVPPAAKVTFLR